MSTLPFALERIFRTVWEISWQASLIALAVLVIQRVFRRWLNPRWRSALWLLVLARLLLPVLPEAPWSAHQYAPAPVWVEPEAPRAWVEPPASAMAPGYLPPRRVSLTFFQGLALVWGAGVLVWVGVSVAVNLSFSRRIRQLPEVQQRSLRMILEDSCRQLGVRRVPRLVETHRVGSPAVMGLWRPTLLLPEGAVERFTPEELRLIFLHELAHLRRCDHWVQCLIAVLHGLHWFNPVLAWAFHRMKLDREPATDALVLSRAGEAHREPYGLTLLKVLETHQMRFSAPVLVGILEDREQLKQRFRLISLFTKKAYAWSALGVVLAVGLGVFFLTQKKQETPLEKTEEERATAFVKAAARGDLKTMKRLYNQGVDPNSRDLSWSGHEPHALYEAADKNQPEVAAWLVRLPGIEVDQKIAWGDRAILRALWRGNLEVAALYKEAGAEYPDYLWFLCHGDVEGLQRLADEGRITPKLYSDLWGFAVPSGQLASVKWLETHIGKPVEGRLLELAGRTGKVPMLAYILEHGREVDLPKHLVEALSSAVGWDQPEAAAFLLKQGVSPDAPDPDWGESRMLMRARSVAMARVLIDAGADVNYKDAYGRTALSENGNGDVVAYLIERGARFANTQEEQWKILERSIHQYDVTEEKLAIILKRGPHIDLTSPRGTRLLVALCQRSDNPNHRAILEMLLKQGADPNQYPDGGPWDRFKTTPLLRAASSGRLDMVRTLLRHGADPNFMATYAQGEESFAQWPAAIATNSGHAEIAREILAAGGKPGSPWVPVLLEANVKKARILVAEGKINQKTANPGIVFSPLDSAIRLNHPEIVRLLLEADGQEKSLIGSPLSTAVSTGNVDMVRLVLSLIPEDKLEGQLAILGNNIQSEWNKTEVRQAIMLVFDETKLKPPASLLRTAVVSYSDDKTHPVEFLLSRGLDADVPAKNGLTARQEGLLRARMFSNEKVARMLRRDVQIQPFHAASVEFAIQVIDWSKISAEDQAGVRKILDKGGVQGYTQWRSLPVPYLYGQEYMVKLVDSRPSVFSFSVDDKVNWPSLGVLDWQGALAAEGNQYRLTGTLRAKLDREAHTPISTMPINDVLEPGALLFKSIDEHNAAGDIHRTYVYLFGIYSAIQEPAPKKN
jgi:bla regulator protein BlaR1